MEQISVLRVPLLGSGDVLLFEGFGDDDFMWSGVGQRCLTVEVCFDRKFAAPPHVQVAISMLDVDQSRNLRYRLEVEDVFADRFQITAHVWGDTRIGRLAASWLAIGEQDAELPAGRRKSRSPKR